MRYHRWLGCQKNIVVHDFFTIFIKINKATNIIISLWFISSLIIFKIFFIILLIMVILKILKIIIKHNFLTFFDRIFFYLLSQIIFNIECIMYIFLLRLVLNIMLSIIIHIIIIQIVILLIHILLCKILFIWILWLLILFLKSLHLILINFLRNK